MCRHNSPCGSSRRSADHYIYWVQADSRILMLRMWIAVFLYKSPYHPVHHQNYLNTGSSLYCEASQNVCWNSWRYIIMKACELCERCREAIWLNLDESVAVSLICATV